MKIMVHAVTAQTKTKTHRMLRFLLGALLTMMVTAPAWADQFDDQISALQSQIKADQAQINSLQAANSSLQAQLSAINAQINQTESELSVLHLKSQQVNAALVDLKQRLATEQAILGENIRTIYREDQLTPLEVLFSSNSFSDFVDKQQYLDKVKTKISSTIADITATKQQLEDQQAQLTTLIGAEQQQQQNLSSQRSEQQALLAANQSQQSTYRGLLAQNQQKLAQVVAAREAAVHSGDLSVTSGGCGGYPAIWCNAPQDSAVDNWNFFSRECVSYVAWKRWANHQSPQPYSWGNAADWWRFTTHYSNPHPGEIAVWRAYANAYVGGFGHVAYVESNDGGTITVSQFNFDVGSGPGRYSRMVLNSTMLQGIGYIP